MNPSEPHALHEGTTPNQAIDSEEVDAGEASTDSSSAGGREDVSEREDVGWVADESDWSESFGAGAGSLVGWVSSRR